MKNRTSLGKITKALRIAALAVIVVLGTLYIYLRFIVRDIPHVDDSSMKVEVKSIPVEKNAYSLLMQAQIPLNLRPCDPVRKKLASYYDLIEKNGKLTDAQLESAMTLFSEKMEMVDRIGDMPYSQGQAFFRLEDPVPNYVSLRDLGVLRLEIARRDLAEGGTARAISGALAVFKYGDTLEHRDGGTTIISLMVGSSLKHKALAILNEALSSGIPAGDATMLMRELGTRRETAAPWENAFKDEYRGNSYVIDRLNQSQIAAMSEFMYAAMGQEHKQGSRLLDFAVKLLFKKERVRRARFEVMSVLVKNAGAEAYSQAVTMDLGKYHRASKVGTWDFFKAAATGEYGTAMYTTISNPDFTKVVERKFFSNMLIDATRLRIAALGYKRDNGRLPATLDELAPSYIPEVPRDPFDGKAMRYDSNKGIIYSVGMNLRDDGGAADRLLFTKNDWNTLRMQKDLVLKIE